MHHVNQAAAFGFLLVDSLYLPGYYNSTPCIPAPEQMLLLYACHRLSIACYHSCHLMKMITCLQCNWQQFVVRYFALLNKKNHKNFKNASELCRCLYLLKSHAHNSKYIHNIAKCMHELHWNSWYLNVTFLLQQDLLWVLWLVLICNEQCIKMMQMLPLHLKEPLKKVILRSGSQCNSQQFVVRYFALLNEKNHLILKNASESCRCLYLL